MAKRYMTRIRPLGSYHPASAIGDDYDLAILPPTPDENCISGLLGIDLRRFIEEPIEPRQTESKSGIEDSVSQ